MSAIEDRRLREIGAALCGALLALGVLALVRYEAMGGASSPEAARYHLLRDSVVQRLDFPATFTPVGCREMAPEAAPVARCFQAPDGRPEKAIRVARNLLVREGGEVVTAVNCRAGTTGPRTCTQGFRARTTQELISVEATGPDGTDAAVSLIPVSLTVTARRD